MARSSWIKPTVRKLFADRAIRYPKASRLDLYTEIKRDLKEMGEVCPAEETAYKLISEARRTPPKFDEPWSMAALVANPLPADAISSVLQVWRYAVNTAEKFSVAQAEWAARLCSAYKDIPLLWFWSFLYAHEERLSIVTNQPMDSFLLDSNLVLTDWERITLARTDFREKSTKYRAERFLPIDQHGNLIEELLHAIDLGYPWDSHYAPGERDYDLSHLIRRLPNLNTLGLTQQARMVYLRWLSYLARGPKWNALTPEQALNIVVELREIIAREDRFRHSAITQEQDTEDTEPHSVIAKVLGQPDSPTFYTDMTAMLRKVGYLSPPKEVNHERAHHKKRK